MKLLAISRTATVALVLTMLASVASGAVTGTLRITSDPGDVIVTATTIDWTPPEGPPDGTFTVGAGTNLTYDLGTFLTIGTLGSILDLGPGSVFPVLGFMTFDDAPGLTFDLDLLGPGPANTVCSNDFDPSDPACAVFAGSPFILTPTATGTAVTLSARGTASDNVHTGLSTWVGAFTTQIAGRTPFEIQQNILGVPGFEPEGGVLGQERSTYSGEFVATFIPEPSTVSLFLVGGGLMALGWRRRLNR